MPLPSTNTRDNREPTAPHRSAAQENSGNGISMPSVPVLHQREQADASQLPAQDGPVQLAVRNTIPNRTRIIIDNPRAPDDGDTGTIIRNSRTEADCKVVEFDNAMGEFYRVYVHEMNPLSAQDKLEHGLPATLMPLGSKEVTLTANIDLSVPLEETADFEAFNGNHKIGYLRLKNSGTDFIISDVYTNVSPEHSVKGLGALFLYISSWVAERLNRDTMLLAANRQNAGEKHPAPFYAKFEFRSADDNADIKAALEMRMEFEEYMEMMGKTAIEMRGNTAAVGGSTGRYLNAMR